MISIDEKLDEIIGHLYHDILKGYWDAERKYIDEKYNTICFPFKEIPSPNFSITDSWTFDQLTGYLNTWSAINIYKAERNQDPLEIIFDDLVKAWVEEFKAIRFPVLLRIGRKIC